MRIKFMFLATLFTLLVGLQTAQAQQRANGLDPTKPVVAGVQGTITVALPLSQSLSQFKCSDILVQIGQYETPTSGLRITTFKTVASRQAIGNISSGTCGYIIPNSSGLEVKTYKIRLGTNANGACTYSIDLSYGGDKLVTFPTGNKVNTVDFKVKLSCAK